jgi:prevent-host-death family protein
MKHVQLRDAKAKLSELVEVAIGGEPTTITRHGVPVAMVVPIERGRELYPGKPKRTIIDVLLEYPGGLDLERDHSPPREIDL